MLHEPLVILDFETTGLRAAAGDRITAYTGITQRMDVDISAMHSGLNLTAQVLRQLMHMPVKQVPARLERLCA